MRATSAIASASAFFHASRAASSGADILSRPCGPSIVKMKLCLCRPRPRHEGGKEVCSRSRRRQERSQYDEQRRTISRGASSGRVDRSGVTPKPKPARATTSARRRRRSPRAHGPVLCGRVADDTLARQQEVVPRFWCIIGVLHAEVLVVLGETTHVLSAAVRCVNTTGGVGHISACRRLPRHALM